MKNEEIPPSKKPPGKVWLASLGRKGRADARLRNLSEERQAELIEWCDTPKSENCRGGYAYALERLAESGMVISRAAVSHFYTWYHLHQLMEQADAEARDASKWMENFRPGDEEAARKFGEFIFMQKAVRTQDSKVFRTATAVRDKRVELEHRVRAGTAALKQKNRQIAQKDRDLELAERRVKVLEERHRQARELIGDAALTPEQKEQRIKAVFGIVE